MGELATAVRREPVGMALSPTELLILELRVSGLTRTEIACRLKRSPQTISNSLTIAKEKIGARSIVEAAALIARNSPRPGHAGDLHQQLAASNRFSS